MPNGLTVAEIEPGVWQITDPGYARPSHAYLVAGNDRAALIDACTGLWDIRATVESLTSLDVVVLQTHAHPDHAGGSHTFEKVMAHPDAIEKLRSGWSNMELKFTIDRYFNDRSLPSGVSAETFAVSGCEHLGAFEDRGVVDLGGRQIDVFFTPGHSPDSVCFLEFDSGLLFTGDSVLKGRIAVENDGAFRRSIREIAKLSSLARGLYPAHGEIPVEADFVRRVMQGFSDAIAGRAPTGFLAGFATYEFDDFGIMLPPRHRRLREQ